jgi:hypothetical protein
MHPDALALLTAAGFFTALMIFLSDSQLLSVLVSSVSAEPHPSNDYCKGPYAPVDEIGDPRTNNYIWLLTDAWSVVQSGDLAYAFPSSRLYHIRNSGYPQVRST